MSECRKLSIKFKKNQTPLRKQFRSRTPILFACCDTLSIDYHSSLPLEKKMLIDHHCLNLPQQIHTITELSLFPLYHITHTSPPNWCTFTHRFPLGSLC